MDIRKLIERGKKQHTALMRFAKRPKRLLWLISLPFTLYGFFKSSGKLSIPLIGLGALTAFLLYYAIPASGNGLLSGIRLFIRRASALLVDLIVISLLIVPLMVWYRAEIQRPEDVLQISAGRTLMLVLWCAVMYFAICDWHYGATIGKRMFALRITDLSGSKLTFCRSFIRTFLSLPLPVLFGVLLALRIDSLPEIHRLVIGDVTKQVFVAFIPLSILFFGGNQSVVDRFTRAVMRAEHEPLHLSSKISAITWILLCLSTVAWAGICSSLFFLPLQNVADHTTRGLPAGMEVSWTASEPDMTRVLWLALPIGLKTPTYAIRNIEIWDEVSVDPTKLKIDNAHFRLSLDPEPYLTEQTKLRVVRVTLARDRPSLLKLILLQNYEALINQNIPATQRPFLSELQLVTDDEYGLFSAGEEEDFLLCALVSNNKSVTFYSPMLPHGAINFRWSLDQIGAVLAGLGIFHPSQSY